MAPIRIAQATEEDIPVILDMILGLAEYERLTHLVTATGDSLRDTLFRKHAAEVLLAYWEDEPAGFALHFPNYSSFLAQTGVFLEDLFVKPHLRGKGIGMALLTRLAAIAKERGCGYMEWGVLDWNEPSIRFYKNLGAQAMDEWTRYRLDGEALNRLSRRAST